MKNLLLILFPFILFAQEKEQAKMMIYPGCEKFEKKGNDKLKDCFIKKIIEELGNESLFVLEKKKIGQIELSSEIKFNIDANGQFDKFEVIGNNFSKELVNEAFIKYLKSLNKKKKKIIPSIDKDGNNTSIYFHLPFVINKSINHLVY